MTHDLLDDFQRHISFSPLNLSLHQFSDKEIRRIIALQCALQTHAIGDIKKLIDSARQMEKYLEGPFMEARS